LAELSSLAGFTISQGDPFDGWSTEASAGNLTFGATIFSFSDLTWMCDELYIPDPSSAGDIMAFFIAETNADGDLIYFALGEVDNLSFTVVPVPKATYLAPGWRATNFMTLEIPSRAIAFDSNKNLYIENTGNDNSGRIEVLQLTAVSGYQDLSRYASYPTNYKGATGLGFDRLGSLFVAERSVDSDAGIIREINVATQTLTRDVMAFANHRPTGVDADTSGNIFYSGRKESSGAWGKIFRINTNIAPAERTELIIDTVATGIAVDTSGDIFISTP